MRRIAPLLVMCVAAATIAAVTAVEVSRRAEPAPAAPVASPGPDALASAAPARAAAPAPALAASASVRESDRDADRRTPVVRAIERARPSVVNISATRVQTVRYAPRFWMNMPDIFRREFGDMTRPRRRVTGALGSGVIISPRGYIATNAHVVEQADEIVVTLADESQHKADLVSADPDNDLAVIKVDAGRPLEAIPIGTSADLMIGETVIAVGNPYGYQHTVTTGVVSAVNRTLEPREGVVYDDLIQTDAPINPGNSGGPLLNIRGELIGINTAIRAGAQGLGFAIPVDRIRRTMSDLLSLRRAGQAWLGLHFASDQAGCTVGSVDRKSPAEAAGLAPGDRIGKLDGVTVPDAIEFETRVLERRPGDKLVLDVTPAPGGPPTSVTVTLAAAPRPQGERLALGMFGLHLQAVTPELTEQLGLWTDRGLLVAGVERESAGWKAGFEAGDVVVQVNQYPCHDLDKLGVLLGQIHKGDRLRVFVVRGRTLARADLEAKAEPGDLVE